MTRITMSATAGFDAARCTTARWVRHAGQDTTASTHSPAKTACPNTPCMTAKAMLGARSSLACDIVIVPVTRMPPMSPCRVTAASKATEPHRIGDGARSAQASAASTSAVSPTSVPKSRCTCS
jgi:hypothetical protein